MDARGDTVLVRPPCPQPGEKAGYQARVGQRTDIMKKSSFVWIVDVYSLREGTYVQDGWFLARVSTLVPLYGVIHDIKTVINVFVL